MAMQPIVNTPEEDRATDIGNMHKNCFKNWFQRYPRGQTDRQTDTQTDMLITILRNRSRRRSNKNNSSSYPLNRDLVGSLEVAINSCLWPPCVADADIIFLPCSFFFCLLYFSLFSSPNLCHTSTHGVALVRI